MKRSLQIPTESSRLLRQNPCDFRGAKKFWLEPKGFCCMSGEVSLFPTSCPPELQELYTSNSDEAKEFRTFVRTYNNTFAFTSFGIKYDKDLCERTHGV